MHSHRFVGMSINRKTKCLDRKRLTLKFPSYLSCLIFLSFFPFPSFSSSKCHHHLPWCWSWKPGVIFNWFIPLKTHNLWQVHLFLPSKCISNLSTWLHLHCHLLFRTTLLQRVPEPPSWLASFCSCPLRSILHIEAMVILLKCKPEDGTVCLKPFSDCHCTLN